MITFPPYCKADLVQIIEDRVGNKFIDPKAIEFAAKKVSASSGDARKVLDLAHNAVTICETSLSPDQLKATTTDEPVVTLKDMLKAAKASTPFADIINGLPLFAKVILCVAVTLNQEKKDKNISEQMTLGLLRNLSMRALDDDVCGDSIDISTFGTLFEQLLDAGLLSLPNHQSYASALLHCSSLYSTPIDFGVQLYDVESALEATLGDQPLFKKVLENARRLTSG